MPDLEVLTARVLEAVVRERGGAARPQQQEMSSAVARAMDGRSNLVVQAGTGVGKSVGYLVPTMLHAAESGKVQLISTASLALQRQILTQDGPLVQRVIAQETGRDVVFNPLKGWSNYVCRYRLDGGLPTEELLWNDPGAGALGAEQVEALREWAQTTETGDRDDLQIPASHAAWAQVSVTKRECLGSGCPFYEDCFAQLSKERAFSSDVVVTNHALLGVYANGRTEVLPEFDALVIDEAHDLASRVRSQGTEQLSAGMLGRVARTVHKCSAAAALDLDDARDALADEIERLPFGLLEARPEGLHRAVQQVDEAVRGGRRELKSSTGGGANAAAELQLARAGLDSVAGSIDLWGQEPDRTITWLSESRAGSAVLNLAPLDVAGLMAGRIFGEHPTILTSATLCLGGSFDQVRQQTGIDWGANSTEFLNVGTSFDPAKQGILYVAKHLPTPGRDGVAEQFFTELVDLVRDAGGGVLGLFSSMAGAQRAAEVLRRDTDLKVLLQGEDNLPTLVNEFREDVDSCLLGTISLWQGVDVPGFACRLVVIDRIPFPRPDDPIVKAQGLAATRARRPEFLDTSLAPAALLMAQGTGRLLRSPTDRGVVAILDSRLASRSYGAYIRSSLLPFWYTEDTATVRASLRRLRQSVSDQNGVQGEVLEPMGDN